MKRVSLLALGIAGMVGFAVPAAAETITGTINFSGSVLYDNRLDPSLNAPNPGSECGIDNTNPTCGAAVIDFLPAGSGEGLLTVIEEANGYFEGIPTLPNTGLNPLGVTTVTILDLNNFDAGGVLDPSTFAPSGPAGIPLNIVGFLSDFTALLGVMDPLYDSLRFDLTEVVWQNGTPCGTSLSDGQSCVLGPFVINQTTQGIGISFDVLGWFRNPITADNPTFDEGFYSGNFGMQIEGLTYATIYDRLATNGLDIGCDSEEGFEEFCGFSANFNPVQPVPEPATLATFGLGALFIGAAYRRRHKKNVAA